MLLAILTVIFVVLALCAWCACVVSKRADEMAERMFRDALYGDSAKPAPNPGRRP